MKAQIKKMKPGVVPGAETEAILLDVEVYMEDQKRYAVIEVYNNELYIAANVISADDEKIVAEYLDAFQWWDDIPMMMLFSIDWSCIGYGFCKLIQWAPEMANVFGGSFSHTAKRFYFDADIYKKRYEEKNAVPCRKNIMANKSCH